MLDWVKRRAESPWYLTFVFATWVFIPEIRRIIDWQTSFHGVSLISIAPLAVLLPAVFFVRSGWPGMGAAYQTVLRLWLFGFGYALLVAFLSGSKFGALYALSLFVLPAAIGFLMMAQPSNSIEASYNRVAQAVLILAAISSLYGIYQWVAPPPWDVYWSRNANITSQGDSVPFSFRIFGTLTLRASTLGSLRSRC